MLVDASDLDVINKALKKGFDVEIRNTEKGVVIRTVSVKVLKRKQNSKEQ